MFLEPLKYREDERLYCNIESNESNMDYCTDEDSDKKRESKKYA